MQELIERYGLASHPEGGWYRETYRAARALPGSSRSVSTAILYLLAEGQRSRLHRIDADGLALPSRGPAARRGARPGRAGAGARALRRTAAGHHPGRQLVGPCPAPGSRWTLCGCTVSPAFEFSAFEIGDTARLLAEFPWRRRKSSRSIDLSGRPRGALRRPRPGPAPDRYAAATLVAVILVVAMGGEPSATSGWSAGWARSRRRPARPRGTPPRSRRPGSRRRPGNVILLLLRVPGGVDARRPASRRRARAPRGAAPWRAVGAAGGLAAAVVLLQALGLDPVRAVRVPGRRASDFALYGTLGNPDFVASVLGVTAPLGIVAALRARPGQRWPDLLSAWRSRSWRSRSCAPSRRFWRWGRRRSPCSSRQRRWLGSRWAQRYGRAG